PDLVPDRPPPPRFAAHRGAPAAASPFGPDDPAPAAAAPAEEDTLYTLTPAIREFAGLAGGRAERWPDGATARLYMPEPSEEDLEALVSFQGKPLPETSASCAYGHADPAGVAAALRDWMRLEPDPDAAGAERFLWVRGWASAETGILGRVEVAADSLTVACRGREDLYTARIWIENALPALRSRRLATVKA
ncbi:MAG: hypothetical protein HZA54_16970, partial [Planctomycetes bacterium]|nr:hypothetical protein [Planctomycetota bacterium]